MNPEFFQAAKKVEDLVQDYCENGGANSELLSSAIEKWERESGPDQKLRDRIRDEFLDCGPIVGLAADPEVTEIVVNSQKEIWYERQGKFQSLSDQFYSKESFESFTHRLCQSMGSETTLDQPFARGIWKSFRVQLVRAPISPTGFQLCLRRCRGTQWSLDSLRECEWASPETIDFCGGLIRKRAKLLIVGPTGCGKTSVLNALLGQVDSSERVLAIEDTDEITLPNKISSKLLTREDPQGILQNIDQSRLIKEALRLRPERIVVGEVRGGEAKDMLMAFATGHEGGLCTLHASSARQALIRLEMLIQLGAPQWSLSAIRHLIHLSLDYVLVLGMSGVHRRLLAIEKIEGVEEFGVLLERTH